MTNKELIEAYLWLTPSNRWSGKRITDCTGPNGEEGFWPSNPQKHPSYNYEYTELDDMPEGWRHAFGEEMCEELNDEIMTWPQQVQENFRITQIKEKQGHLCIYTSGESEQFRKIVSKYAQKSKYICINCGAPARWISRVWISPWCDDCARENFELLKETYSTQTSWGKEYFDINKYYIEQEEG